MKNILTILLIFISTILLAQTKVSGLVIDEDNYPVPFANVIFKNSTTGTITDENGRFYLESSERYRTLASVICWV